jgi:hypothetical protein
MPLPHYGGAAKLVHSRENKTILTYQLLFSNTTTTVLGT